MARKKRDYRRPVLPDPKFGEEIVTKFINTMMWDGKRSLSESVLYGAIEIAGERANEEGVKILHRALSNVRPMVEVRSRRVGGATYQVPTEVRPKRQNALAIRWLIGAARSRSEKSMQDRLAYELLEASQNRGNAVKKKEDVHKMAEANRAFAHYRW